MTSTTKTLHERRLRLIKESREIAERAAEANRPLDAEEERQFTELNAEADAIGLRVNALLEGEKRAKETEDKFAELEGRTVEPGKEARSNGQATELRAFLRGDGPRAYEVKPEGPVNFRDLSKLTAGAGGNVVPTSFYNRLVAHLIENSAMLQTGPTVLNTASGESIQIPKTTAHSLPSGAAPTAEAGPIAESDPVFGQVTLGAFKYGVLLEVSTELVTDSGVDLEGYLAMQAGRAIGNAFGQDLVTGTGSGEPRGVILDAGPGFTPAAGLLAGGGFGSQSTADQGFDILINVYHSVISPYRNSASCAWLMNDTTASRVRKIKSSEGVYAWQPSVTVGAPDTILGKPVFIDPNVASPGANTESIAFGDFAQYFVRLVGGVRFERSDDFRFGNDLVAFRALLRGDGALVDLTGAIKTLTHPAT